MKTKRIMIAVPMVMVMAFFLSCATTGTQPLTAKQQATVWMSVYNQTYDDTMATMQNPASTGAQKVMALKKKDILVKVWPLLRAYVSLVDSGGTPSATDTAAITDLINQLATLAGGA